MPALTAAMKQIRQVGAKLRESTRGETEIGGPEIVYLSHIGVPVSGGVSGSRLLVLNLTSKARLIHLWDTDGLLA